MTDQTIKGRIIVVDDNEDLSDFIKQELENQNYYAITARDQKEAMEICSEKIFDIGLIDYQLGDCTGLELIKDLETLNPSMDYIIVTGQPSLNSAIEASQHNKILYYEEKPINFDRLISFIDHRMDKVRMEEALKKSEEKYRLMVENSRDAIITIQNDKFVYLNNAFSKMLGRSSEDLIFMDYKNIFNEKVINKIEELKNHRNNGKNGHYRFETTLQNEDGNKIYVEANAAVINYNDEEAIFAIIRDITKQKEILETLQKSDKHTDGLNDVIPICAGCNKIRDDEKEDRPWLSPAEYISERLPDIIFTHGICPECAEKWYPEYKKHSDKKKADKDS